MTNNFDELYRMKDAIAQYESTSSPLKFYQQEVLRFISIAGTLQANGFLENNQDVNSRYFTHILTRSLLENFFIIIYIFDDKLSRDTRFEEILNGFKRDYLKLYNESELPHKEKLAEPQEQWNQLARPKDIKSILETMRNDNGGKLGFLYFIYRVTSFDVHGKNLNVFLEQSFEDNLNFPVLNLENAFELIANEYLCIWSGLENRKPSSNA